MYRTVTLQSTTAHPLPDAYRKLIILPGIVSMIVGVMGLMGYFLGIPALKNFSFSQQPEIAFASTLCFISLGLTLWLIAMTAKQHSKNSTRIIDLLLWGVFLTGAVNMTRYLIVANFSLSDIYTHDYPAIKMAFETSVEFMLIAFGYWLIRHKSQRNKWVTYGIGLTSLMVFLLCCYAWIGYLFHLPVLYSFAQSVPALLGLTVLSLVLLIVSIPLNGLLAPIRSKSPLIKNLSMIAIVLSLAILGGGIYFISEINGLLTHEIREEMAYKLIATFEFANIFLVMTIMTLSLRALHYFETTKLQEGQLRDQLEFRRALTESVADGIFAIDQNARLVYMNPAAERMLGWHEADLLGKSMHNAIHFQHHNGTPYPQSDCPVENVLNTGQPIIGTEEDYYTRKDGTLFPISYSSTPILLAGKAIGVVCAFHDKTIQKQAEMALKQSVKELSDFKYAVDESAIVAITDQAGGITYVNDAFVNISKYPREELIGKTHRIINSGYHPHEFFEEMWTTITQGKVWQGEIRNRAKDGSFYWVKTTIVPFLNENHKPVQYIAIRLDITPQKQAQEELCELFGELEKRVERRTLELSETNTRLQEEMAEREEIERALSESERRFRAIFNQTFQFMGLIRPDGTLIEANETALQFIDARPDEVLGKLFWETPWWTHSSETQNQLIQGFQKAIRGEFVRFETSHEGYIQGHQGKVKNQIQIDFSLKPIFDEKGQVVLIIPEGRDITEMKKTKDALIESERRFRAVFNQTFEYIGLLKPDGEIVLTNETALQFAGTSSQEVIHRRFWETDWWNFSTDIQKTIQEAVRRAALGEFLRFETQAQGANGKIITVDFSIKPIRDEDGKVTLLIPEGRDVTEMRKTQDALAESEERFKTMADCAPMMIWMFDETINVSYLNKTWLDFTGLDETKALGYGWKIILHPEETHDILVMMLEAIEKRQSILFEHRVKRYDGQYRWLITQCSPRITPDGTFSGYIGSAIDITQQKEMLAQLEAAKAVAETANQQKTQVLAFVSHDFKNPLNAIIGYSEMLESGIGGPLTEKQEKYVYNIHASSSHLFSMVTDILDIARAEAGKLPLAPAWIELEPFLFEIQSIMSPLAEQKQVSLSCEIAPGMTGFTADPKYLRLILINLISNAIKYNRVQGQVTCRMMVSPDKRQVICQVSDTGLGISADKLSLLFNEYYRVPDKEASREEGTGLGLAFIKKLVELHQGRIEVESQPEIGSTFTLRLPQPAPFKGNPPVGSQDLPGRLIPPSL